MWAIRLIKKNSSENVPLQNNLDVFLHIFRFSTVAKTFKMEYLQIVTLYTVLFRNLIHTNLFHRLLHICSLEIKYSVIKCKLSQFSNL